MAALAAAVLTLTGALAGWRSRNLARPIGRLRDAATILGSGGQVARAPASGIGEIDAVHEELHTAAERVRDAMLRERAFSADVAHQLRTPIASLRLRLETEQQLRSDPDELIEQSLGDLDRLEATITDLLTLERDIPSRRPHPLASVIRDAASRWHDTFAHDDRDLHVSVQSQLPFVTANAAAIGQILDVLLDNARSHGLGTVTVTAQRLGDGATIAISDQGVSRVDPATAFQRRSSERGSTGIGLALARRLADAEGMRLVLADPGPGPAFHLIVPAARRPPASDAANLEAPPEDRA